MTVFSNIFQGKTLTGNAPIHWGSKKVLGVIPTPDVGYTEYLQGSGTPTNWQGGSTIVNPQPQEYLPQGGQNFQTAEQIKASYTPQGATGGGTPPGGQVLGTNQVNDNGGGGGGGPSVMDQINEAYNTEMGTFKQIESGAQSTAAAGRTQLQGEAEVARTSTEAERGNRVQELGTRRQQVGLDVQAAGTRIKQMLSDLQNRNAAFLASRGGGAFESSLGAAVGEKFGKTAMGEMGGLENQRVGALGSISDEAGRVQTFYDTKMGEITTNLQKGLATIGAQLQDTLSKIGLAKGQSAQAKAAATMDAWNNYANWRSQLGIQALNIQQTLAQWALEKGNSLKSAQEFALQNTPTINPSSFGISAPNQPMNTGLITPNNLSYAPQAGVSIKGGKKEEDVYPYLQTFA